MTAIRLRLVTFIVLVAFISTNIKVNLNRKVSHDNQKHLNSLNHEFSKFKTLSKFIKNSKLNSKFLQRNSADLKKKWDKYQKIQKKYEAISSKSTSEIEVINIDSAQYNADISIGTPPQHFQLQLDTGSSDLWTYAFNPSQSETFVDLNKKYSRAYGQASFGGALKISGYLGEDTVTFGGHTLENYKIAVVNETNQPQPGYGIIGLSTIFISYTGATPLIQEFYNQGFIEKPVFSFYLTSAQNSTGSVLILGEPDSNYYTGEINYFNLNIKSWWEFEIKGFELYGQLLPYSYAFLDTGTSVFVVPVEYHRNVIEVLSNNVGDPKAALVVENQKFPLISEIINVNNFIRADVNFIVLGDIFLFQYYTVFDYENYRVGIANLNPNLQ